MYGGKNYTLIRDQQTTLRSGDYYQVYLHLFARCYIYLIQESKAEGGITTFQWLFPSTMVSLENPLEPGDYWIPPRDTGFQLDETPGRETISLVASLIPLEDLNDLANRALTGRNVGEEIGERTKVRSPGRPKPGPPIVPSKKHEEKRVPGYEPPSPPAYDSEYDIAFTNKVSFFHK